MLSVRVPSRSKMIIFFRATELVPLMVVTSPPYNIVKSYEKDELYPLDAYKINQTTTNDGPNHDGHNKTKETGCTNRSP